MKVDIYILLSSVSYYSCFYTSSFCTNSSRSRNVLLTSGAQFVPVWAVVETGSNGSSFMFYAVYFSKKDKHKECSFEADIHQWKHCVDWWVHFGFAVFFKYRTFRTFPFELHQNVRYEMRKTVLVFYWSLLLDNVLHGDDKPCDFCIPLALPLASKTVSKFLFRLFNAVTVIVLMAGWDFSASGSADFSCSHNAITPKVDLINNILTSG